MELDYILKLCKQPCLSQTSFPSHSPGIMSSPPELYLLSHNLVTLKLSCRCPVLLLSFRPGPSHAVRSLQSKSPEWNVPQQNSHLLTHPPAPALPWAPPPEPVAWLPSPAPHQASGFCPDHLPSSRPPSFVTCIIAKSPWLTPVLCPLIHCPHCRRDNLSRMQIYPCHIP